MARRPVVLVTGAGGEIGHGLIHEIAERGTFDILALDVRPLAPEVARRCATVRVGDILDRHLLDRLHAEFEIAVIFHLAALLSTRAEFVPETAHAVNVQGTLNLLALAIEEGRELGQPVKFLFPSSIAVYGLPDVGTKRAAGKVAEDAWLAPITIYGCTKLHCEHLGRYYARHYRQLAAVEPGSRRLPGDPLPRPALRRHDAERRHQRLRAGDAARRRPGPAVRLLRAPGHAHSLHGDARRRRRPAGAHGRARRSR